MVNSFVTNVLALLYVSCLWAFLVPDGRVLYSHDEFIIASLRNLLITTQKVHTVFPKKDLSVQKWFTTSQNMKIPSQFFKTPSLEIFCVFF